MPGRWPMCGPPTDTKPDPTDTPSTDIWTAAPAPHPVRDLLLNTAVAALIAGLFIWLAIDIGTALTRR
jgi:predicted secreted protein